MGDFASLIFVAIGFFFLYWTIRLAVRHALADHARNEAGSGTLRGRSIES